MIQFHLNTVHKTASVQVSKLRHVNAARAVIMYLWHHCTSKEYLTDESRLNYSDNCLALCEKRL